ncbi:hypothetical protein L249_8876, partial [Ophiocordyceps polyrhachis-furcata BCC 54312]
CVAHGNFDLQYIRRTRIRNGKTGKSPSTQKYHHEACMVDADRKVGITRVRKTMPVCLGEKGHTMMKSREGAEERERKEDGEGLNLEGMGYETRLWLIRGLAADHLLVPFFSHPSGLCLAPLLRRRQGFGKQVSVEKTEAWKSIRSNMATCAAPRLRQLEPVKEGVSNQ